MLSLRLEVCAKRIDRVDNNDAERNDGDFRNKMVQKHHIEEVAGGRERTLAEKLPDNFEVKTPTQTWCKEAPVKTPGVRLTGAMEIHRLAVENKLNLSLKGREAELTVDIINATCTTDGWTNYKEVIQSPRSLSLQPPPPQATAILWQ